MSTPVSAPPKDPPLARPPFTTAMLLRDLVQDHTGMFFDNDRTGTLLDKLEPLAVKRGCRSFLEYYYHLKLEGEVSGEWQQVLEALSVQETYFWREMDQVRALVDILIPRWFAHQSRPLRIWSAACATGDEPFTIAMAIQEAGWFQRAPIEILASDASVSALEKARRGIYRERAFRNLPHHLREKYFQAVPHGWSIAPELLVRVRFQRANLVIPSEWAVFGTAPVVFCRNVFIYFSHETIGQTVKRFAQKMPENAYLFVGATESLLKLSNDFELQELGPAFGYIKKSEAQEPLL